MLILKPRSLFHLAVLHFPVTCQFYASHLLWSDLKGYIISDEKAQLAHHMYELVGKYVRRLDQETHKFKMELEADNMGITEILEKRNYFILHLV
jgi:hypothetical protein